MFFQVFSLPSHPLNNNFMQNKILIGIICLLVAVLFVNSAFKNGKSAVGKEYVTITTNRFTTVISSNSETFSIQKDEDKKRGVGDFTDGLKYVSEYHAKGYNVVNTSFYTIGGGSNAGMEILYMGVFMEKE